MRFAVADFVFGALLQADCIFLVADAGLEPVLGEYEKLLIGMKTTARKELVLLHTERNVIPGSTRQWLKVSLRFDSALCSFS